MRFRIKYSNTTDIFTFFTHHRTWLHYSQKDKHVFAHKAHTHIARPANLVLSLTALLDLSDTSSSSAGCRLPFSIDYLPNRSPICSWFSRLFYTSREPVVTHSLSLRVCRFFAHAGWERERREETNLYLFIDSNYPCQTFYQFRGTFMEKRFSLVSSRTYKVE